MTPRRWPPNRWFIDLLRTQHVCPPSAPTDGFLQIINNMKAGRTAMTIHHIGSANDMVAALGDAITAVLVPRGPDRGVGPPYGDGSNAVFAPARTTRPPGAGSPICRRARTTSLFNKLTGQMTGDDIGRRELGRCSRSASSMPR